MEAKTPLWVSSEQALTDLLRGKGRLIVLWYASWCPFCKRVLPFFERFAAESVAAEPVFAVVQDDEEHLAALFAVDIFPTALWFEQGVIAGRLDGAPGVGLREAQLSDFIRNVSSPG